MGSEPYINNVFIDFQLSLMLTSVIEIFGQFFVWVIKFS